MASPVDGTCANKRPVQGRRAAATPVQATLVPLAAGHGLDVAARVQVPAAMAPAPFSADAPEATFSMAQLHAGANAASTRHETEPVAVLPVRTARPSAREIRGGRTAAASRAPIAEVRIPIAELDGATLMSEAQAAVTGTEPSTTLTGIDQLVERVRQRTAARLSRTGVFHPA